MGRIAIKSEREYIREVFRKIQYKEYAVPVFQRDFVWKENQVIELFDSISKGYPIGSLVLWESKDIKKSKNIITDEIIDMPNPKYYILDGRQRLTSLFGCFSKTTEKPIFNLYYNLDTQCFEYPKKKNIHHISVSDLYDTLSLLNALEILKEKITDTSTFQLFTERAKTMNSIFQEYVIGEVLISDCTLKEASVVFNRINSKGTFINKIDMLQALSYKSDNEVVLQHKLDQIRQKLKSCEFQNIAYSDILNNCFWLLNKRYYDSKIAELENYNLDEYLPRISDALISAVSFLRKKCFVLSYELLPYKGQLLILTWFFLKHKEPTEYQYKELRKWFFYTSVTKLFQNGSLSNVRNIHNRFEEFINGSKTSAFDYIPIDAPNFDITNGRASASSKLLVSMHLYYYLKSEKWNEHLKYYGLYKPFGNIAIANIPKFTLEDSNLFARLRQSNITEMDRYGLNNEAIIAIIENDKQRFLDERRIFINEISQQIFSEMDIATKQSNI